MTNNQPPELLSDKELRESLLVGYCDIHYEWYKFTDDPADPTSRNHECGNRPSTRIGYQVTSQRTSHQKTNTKNLPIQSVNVL